MADLTTTILQGFSKAGTELRKKPPRVRETKAEPSVAAPTITVQAPEITVEAAQIHVPAPKITVLSAPVNIPAPVITIEAQARIRNIEFTVTERDVRSGAIVKFRAVPEYD